MSIEQTRARPAPGAREFRRLSLVVILVLAVLAAGLGVVNAVQGPGILSATFNAEAAISRAGQRLVLTADQQLAPDAVDHVSVTPDAPFEAIVDGGVLTIRFTGMLHYATEYTVRAEVRGLATGTAATLEHRFTTPDLEVYSLARVAEGDDLVLRHALMDIARTNEVAFEAPRIQEYTVLPEGIAAIVLDDADTPSLVFAARADGRSAPLPTAPARVLRKLESTPGGLLGYIADAPLDSADPHRSTLYIHDLTDQSGVPREITGPSGTPLTAMDWMFVPGTGSLIVHATDQQLYLVDVVAGGEPVILGRHTELRGVLPGELAIIVADPTHGSIVDLVAGTTTMLELPEPDISPELYPGQFVLLGPTDYVELYANPLGSTASDYRSILVRTDETGSTEVFHPASTTSRIDRLCVSPNGALLAVEVISETGVPDEYATLMGYTDTQVSFVDLATGETVRAITGFLPDWCR